MTMQPLQHGSAHIQWPRNLHGRWLLVSVSVIAVVVLAIVIYAVVQPADVPPAVNSASERPMPARAAGLSSQPNLQDAPASFSPVALRSTANGFGVRLPYRPQVLGGAPNGFGVRLVSRPQPLSSALDGAHHAQERYLPMK